MPNRSSFDYINFFLGIYPKLVFIGELLIELKTICIAYN